MDTHSASAGRGLAIRELLSPVPAIALALALLLLILVPGRPRQALVEAAPSSAGPASGDAAPGARPEQVVIIAISPSDVVYMTALLAAEAELRDLLGEEPRGAYLLHAQDRASANELAKLVIEDVGHFTSVTRLDAVIVERASRSEPE